MKTYKTTYVAKIKAKNLKSEDCDYKGERLCFDKKEKLYIRGSWFNPGVSFFETIEELKIIL